MSARNFINFAKSPDGQKIVDAANFVDLIPVPVPKKVSSLDCELSNQYSLWHRSDAQKLCEIESQFQQLSTSFFFRSSSDQLDPLAHDQIARVYHQITLHQAKAILLAGFADSQGSYYGNCLLALSRADDIASQLEMLGISIENGYSVSVVSFCAEHPIDSNSTSEGRQKNRRVEVYIK